MTDPGKEWLMYRASQPGTLPFTLHQAAAAYS